jgi:hypothetical protein
MTMDGSHSMVSEIREGGEKPENLEQRKLDEATYEPVSYMEETGDYKQSESVQNAIGEMIDNALAQANPAANGLFRLRGQEDAGRAENASAEILPGHGDAGPGHTPGALNDAGRPVLQSAMEPAGDGPTPVSPPARESGQMERRTAAIDLMVGTANMQEMQMSFNLQYLMLENKISHENRQFSMVSNMIKNKHDTAKNSINNIR